MLSQGEGMAVHIQKPHLPPYDPSSVLRPDAPVKLEAVLGDGTSDPEASRQHFRQFQYAEVAGPRQALSQLRGLCLQWLRPEIHSKQQILELLVLEQFLSILPQEIRAWVKSQQPDNGEEVVTLVENLTQVLEVGAQPSRDPETLLHQGNSEDEEKPGVLLLPSSQDEWGQMNPGQSEMFKDTKQEKCWNLVSLGASVSKPDVIPELDGRTEPQILTVQGTEEPLGPRGDCPVWETGTEIREPTIEAVSETIALSGSTAKRSRRSIAWDSSVREVGDEDKLGRQKANPARVSPRRALFPRSFRKVVFSPKITCGENGHEWDGSWRAFGPDSKLDPHQRGPGTERPRPLSARGKIFRQFSDPIKCKRIRVGQKAYKCKECGKTFSDCSTCIRHQRIHTGENPYTCKECGEAFTRSTSLIEHQRTHTGEKPYDCSECEKAFTRRSSLIKHQRVHTGEKPYGCGVCGKAFSHGSALIIHQRIHTGEKPYKCNQCVKAFSNSSALIRHQQHHSV